MNERDTDDDDEAMKLLNKQIADAEIDRKNKRDSLYQTELAIVKSQGAPNWSPTPIQMKKDPNNPLF